MLPIPANPFLDVPPEIIATILDFVDLNQHSLAGVASVCKQWQSIIWSRPQYWTTLHVIIPQFKAGERKLVEYMTRWFGRAGDLPLELHLSRYPFQTPGVVSSPLIDYLLRNRRWQSLSFDTTRTPASGSSMDHLSWLSAVFSEAVIFSIQLGHGCWDNLQSITIDSPHAVMGVPFDATRVAPSLKIFHVNLGFAIVRGPFSSMKSLQTVSLVGVIPDADDTTRLYSRIIAEGECLRSLKIHDLHSTESASSVVAAPSSVLNTALMSLDLRDSAHTRRALESLTLPALVDLKVGREGLDALTIHPPPTIRLGSSILQLAERSQFKLRTLCIGPLCVPHEDLAQMMSSLPTLEELFIHHTQPDLECTAYDFIAEMADRQNTRKYLPALRLFSLSDDVCSPNDVPEVFRLIEGFRRFVETPRRWCNASVFVYAEGGGMLEANPEDGWGPQEYPTSLGPCHPLESAKLFVGRTGECAYWRVVER